jgi:hypothetical protein
MDPAPQPTSITTGESGKGSTSLRATEVSASACSEP